MKALSIAPYSQTGEGKLKLVVINVHIKGPHLIFDKPITIGMIMSFSCINICEIPYPTHSHQICVTSPGFLKMSPISAKF